MRNFNTTFHVTNNLRKRLLGKERMDGGNQKLEVRSRARDAN